MCWIQVTFKSQCRERIHYHSERQLKYSLFSYNKVINVVDIITVKRYARTYCLMQGSGFICINF